MVKMMKTRRWALAMAAMCVLCSAPTGAWGVVGHRVVARIALSQMTPGAIQSAKAILGDDDFVASSTWADEIRSKRPETSNWHFVDIMVGDSTYVPARDCKPTDHGDCIIAELERDQHDVADTTLSAEQRKEALKFLIHFVGDLHQPLHCIDNHDRGGNDVHAHLESAPEGKQTNLHSLWDSGLLNARGMSEEKYGEYLIEQIKTHPPATERIDYTKWALASHAIAVQRIYGYTGFTAGAPPTGVLNISDAAVESLQPIVDQQITLAGERLAMILNQILR